MKKAAAILAIAGVFLLAVWLTAYFRNKTFQFVAQQQIAIENHRDRKAKDPQDAPAKPDIPERTPHPEPGSVIAKLEIPRIGLSVAVVEGAGDRQLRVAAGHIPGTALPGENSNVAFAAHRDTHFRPLRSVRLDDEITVTAGNRLYAYRVVSTKIVSPEDIHVLYPADRETLTLVTCYPFNYIGSAPQRFIVRAECTNCSR